MKKGLILTAVLLLAFATVLVGCAGGPMVYDKSVSLDQSSTIRINNYHAIHFFDGKKVNWVTSSFNKKLVTIPAGEHTFDLYTDVTYLGNRYSGNVDVTYDFLPGHTYFVFGAIDIRSQKIYGRVVDEALMNDELVPDPTNPDASPIEGKWVDVKKGNLQLTFVGDEFVFMRDGKYGFRGTFNFNATNFPVIYYAAIKNGKFVPDAGGALTCSFDGTTLKFFGDQYKKVE